MKEAIWYVDLSVIISLLSLNDSPFSRSIGVSNFGIQHLEEMQKRGCLMPSVNQIQLHPYYRQEALVKYCQEKGIAVMGYSPLTKGKYLNERPLVEMAKRYY